MVFLLANLRVNELLCDRDRDVGRRCLADEMQHHIERRRTARAGEHTSIYHIKVSAELERRKLRMK